MLDEKNHKTRNMQEDFSVEGKLDEAIQYLAGSEQARRRYPHLLGFLKELKNFSKYLQADQLDLYKRWVIALTEKPLSDKEAEHE